MGRPALQVGADVGEDGGMAATRLGYRPELDGVRAIAVTSVMLAHARVTGFERIGIGVDIFFALSGYLITRILLDEWRRTGGLNLSRFVTRRAYRLAPALVVLVAACYVFASHLPNGTREGTLPALLYFSNWQRALVGDIGALGHTWSLAVEEQFYLLWPITLLVALRVGGERFALWAAVSGACLVVLYREWATDRLPIERIYNGFDFRADGLLFGCALALWMSRGGRMKGWWVVVALALTAWNQTHELPISYHAIGALGACALIAQPGWAMRPLTNRTMRWLGKRAYGLYLWHYPLIRWLLPEDDDLWRVGVMVGLSVVLSAASFRWIESPVLAWRDRRDASADLVDRHEREVERGVADHVEAAA